MYDASALCWGVILTTVVRLFFNSRPSLLRIVAVASLIYLLINTSSMVYVVSLYFQEELNKDTVCFDYFKRGTSPDSI